MTPESEKSLNQLRAQLDDGEEPKKFIRPKDGEKIYSLGSIDYMLLEILGTEWADKIISKVFEKMKGFDANGETYSDIIRDYYFIEDKMDDVDIQVELNIGRTFYYRMKKAAITLFGILLWNIVVEECIRKTA